MGYYESAESNFLHPDFVGVRTIPIFRNTRNNRKSARCKPLAESVRDSIERRNPLSHTNAEIIRRLKIRSETALQRTMIRMPAGLSIKSSAVLKIQSR